MQPLKPLTMLSVFNRLDNQPILGVKRKYWRKDDDHAEIADVGFSNVRTDVLQRDNYTCRFCGFRAAKYQEVHHQDDDHHNNDRENLLTICTLCHQCHHLGMCGMRNGGFLAPIPELTQVEVNHIVRAIHVTDLIATSNDRDKLKSLFASFRFRGDDYVKRLFGGEISMLEFASLLSDPRFLTDDMYEKRSEVLSPLRLVASKDAFHSGQLEYYAANNRSLFLPDNWTPLTRQLFA